MENAKIFIIKQDDELMYKIKITPSQAGFFIWLLGSGIIVDDISVEEYEGVEPLDFTKL
jgi:hypothetical protein